MLVDEENNVKKIITKTDLIALIASRDIGNFTAHDYMTQKVITVRPEENANSIPELLTQYNISRVIVVCENKPIDIITTRDMISKGKYFGISSHRLKEIENRHLSSRIRILPFTAEDIMTSNPLILIEQQDSITNAARLMLGNQISGIPVVNKLQELVGIITKTDIIKAIVDFGTNKGQ